MLQFTQGVNNVLMFGWLGIFILIGVSVVFLLAFIYKTQDVNKSVSATAFIAFSLSISLRALDLLPDLALYITLIAVAVGIAFSRERSTA